MIKYTLPKSLFSKPTKTFSFTAFSKEIIIFDELKKGIPSDENKRNDFFTEIKKHIAKKLGIKYLGTKHNLRDIEHRIENILLQSDTRMTYRQG
jgi:uncharacterized protein YpuA (DUF1002 family)